MPIKEFKYLTDYKVYVGDTYWGTAKDLCIELDESEESTEEGYADDYVVCPVKLSDKGSFECRITLKPITYLKIVGIWDFVILACSDNRIVHLMKHGKNDRVKMKNFKRALRRIMKYSKHNVEEMAKLKWIF